MRCLEKERLVEYAYGLMNEPDAVEVRGHLEECSHCRRLVEQHNTLGAVLDDWKALPPSPEFDARVREAIDADRAHSRGWGWDWVRSLALASLGVMVVAGAVWFGRNHRGPNRSSQVNASVSQPEDGARTAVKLPGPNAHAQSAEEPSVPVIGGQETETAGVASEDERVARAMEDYDLAANFDLLSEIPKGEGATN